MASEVVIVGGGFGGLYAARRLEPRHVTMRGRSPRPFRYRTIGVFVDMGQHKGVAIVLGVRLRGFPAWFAARSYHLMMMSGVARKMRLGLDWGVGLFFGRASAELGQLGHRAALREPGGGS